MADKKQGFLFDDKEDPAKDKTDSSAKPAAAARDAVLDKYDPEKLPARAGGAAVDDTDPMIGMGANFTPRDFDADDPPIAAASGRALGKAAMTSLPPGAVQGKGGYVYRMNEDGSIKIEFDPTGKANGLVLRKGSAYDAIKKELGGETAAPPESKPAETTKPAPAAEPKPAEPAAKTSGLSDPATEYAEKQNAQRAASMADREAAAKATAATNEGIQKGIKALEAQIKDMVANPANIDQTRLAQLGEAIESMKAQLKT